MVRLFVKNEWTAVSLLALQGSDLLVSVFIFQPNVDINKRWFPPFTSVLFRHPSVFFNIFDVLSVFVGEEGYMFECFS